MNRNKPQSPRKDHPEQFRRMLLQGFALSPFFGLMAGCGGGSGDAAGADAASDASGTSASGSAAPSSDSSSSTAAPTTSESASAPTTSESASAPTQLTFRHPGLLHTEEDFARMRAKIAAGEQPWVNGWSALTSSGRAHLNAAPRPLETVIRGGTGDNVAQMYIDMQRTYQLALRWKISGDTAYADLAVQFLNAWSSTMKVLGGNADRFLAAGIYGYQWANAAEIMRTYPGWAAEDVARFQKLLLDVFYPLSHDFLIRHNGAVITNYWANWDLCSLCGILAIGVFCDRPDLYDEAIAYYKHGRGNGAAAHNVYVLHPGYLGQVQESGRDQGHCTLVMALGGSLCEMAWNQGEDLYGLHNNRFLAGAEYVAKTNLRDANGAFYTMPFATYINNHGTQTAVSDAGRPHVRPCWELIYNHYVNRKGLSAPWVAAMAAQLRPEGGTSGGDQPGFGTLTHSRDAFAAGRAASGLTGYVTAGQVLLSWWGSAQATSYNVKRGASANGPFTTIASVTDPRTHTDAPGNGIWYYTVTALDGSGESVVSNVVRVSLPTETRLQLPLDAVSGTVAADASGYGLDGTLVGGASWGEGRNGGRALALDGSSGHIALPQGVLSELSDFTISVWVYWNAAANNARVFDFGSSDIAYLALIPRDARGSMRFMVSGTHWYGDQNIATSALPTGRWVHLAVTLSGTTGILYVDGVAAGTNNAITFPPFQLGNTTQNWLGRSQYGVDPYFNGRMQDFRVWSGALSASEIAALAAS